MLTFDENGFLTPPDPIPGNMKLLESEFVIFFGNETRQRLFERLTRYLDDLKRLVNEELTIWVNGSFVTKKLNPKDIDVVIFLDWRKLEQFSKELIAFSHEGALENYGIDSYLVRVYEPSHKKHILTHSDRLHWLYDFSRTQPNRRGKIFKKGFLEIKY